MKLLQLALFKLEKDDSGTLFRGVSVTWMPLADFRAELQDLRDRNEPLVVRYYQLFYLCLHRWFCLLWC